MKSSPGVAAGHGGTGLPGNESHSGSLAKNWHQDRSAVRDLIEQIMALKESSSDGAESPLTRQMIRLRWWVAAFLTLLGDNAAQSILIGERLLADMERVLGTDRSDTLAMRNNLAETYRAVGRITEAITLDEQTLADRERVLGADHPDTLISRNNLAAAYVDAGRTAEAITFEEQILPAMERVLGAEHPNTLISHNNLAAAYLDAGRTAEATTLRERASLTLESNRDPSDP
jgi:tetratricopeptide (TPR) repeat protein